MNKIHSIFRKTHKLLFSAVALLLILCITPISAFADELYTGGAVDSNGSQGNTSIGSGGKSNGKSEAGTHRSTSSKWIGYRIYMVDDKGNLLKDDIGYFVTDLYCNNMTPSYSKPEEGMYGTTLRVNNNNVSLSSIDYYSINTINAMSGIAGQMPAPTVAAGGYESPNGEAFKAWMNLENNTNGADGKPYRFNTNWLVMTLWGQDAYITYLKDQDTFRSAIDYLIANLNESSDDKRGKHGYLKSDNIEQDIVIKSWRAEDKEIFDSVYEKIMESSAKELYETSNNIGVQGEQVNFDTGEILPIHLPDLKLTDTMKMAGFTSWDSVYTYFSSSARFEDKFSELVPATLRKKKFKRS